LFVWIDEDPDIAFERAALLFDVAEITWDMSRILWNGAVDVFNAGVIPVWNTATYYLVEPAVVLLLEVFSLIFMKQHWEGLISENDFPYNGLDCTANAESASWCGRYGFYKAELEAPERAPVFADESESFARRMMLELPDNYTYTFGLETARRLQEQSGGGFAAPSFSNAALTSALNEAAVFIITMVPSLLDVVFGILGDIIKTSFSVLMDALFMVLKSVMMVLKMLLKSGMLTTVVTIGVDFAIIVTPATPTRAHARLRPLTATRRACAVPHRDCAAPALCGHRRAHVPPGLLQAERLERPAGVPRRALECTRHACATSSSPLRPPLTRFCARRCIEETCFTGPDAAADLLVFFSMPIIIGRFTAIMDATLNSRSGKRFFTAPKSGAVSSKGRTRDPETGQTLNNNEPESAGMGNPMYEFDFAGAWDDFSSTTAADECAKCFVCKVIVWPRAHPRLAARSTGPAPLALRCAQVPELRILWWFIASIGSLVSPSNFAMYAGNVTDNCQTQGQWYIDACGSWGTELLPYGQWKRGRYTAGIAQIDTNIFDSYAAVIIDLNERLGAGRDPFFAQYVQAAHQWQSVDPQNMEERALAFVYHS